MTSIPPEQPGENGHKALRPLDIERGERLLYRLTEFGRLLWESGISVGPQQLLDLAETLNEIDITSKEDFYYTLKCSLLNKHELEPVFEQMYHYFWFVRDNPRRKKEKPGSQVRKQEQAFRLPPSERKRLAEHMNASEARRDMQRASQPTQKQRSELSEAKAKDDNLGDPQAYAYSAIERLRQKDFEHYTWEEIQEAKRLMADMRWNLGMRRTRRKAPARRGSYLDMRRLVRHNLKYGAEMVELTRREIKYKPRPLVIICDISGSMSLYSRLLLHFIHTISNGLQNVEAFVFGTRLTRITHQLKRRDVDEAVRDVSKSVQDWSGGTRIGDALHIFNQRWARRVLGRGAVVLIISDGWDRGQSEVLQVEMDRLQHSCHRLIWLNPLLGAPDYRPLTMGMKTALNFIDDFLPAHNLDSLISLGNILSTIDDSRPVRNAYARRKAVEAWTRRKVPQDW
ncbi:hypothetical protein EI42_00195 [Thermosporothrix hazakensis]|jgi:uncharacterized protein with von Willebrand factor type A (vWA) domain|uniref:VWFA domain-containing protein n=1 Tax=Thermosporothrix hazakensis TaxID=644383 RepID=A0A326UDL6_THEHA|nr:VWA domain-containing protein [Thermosporothrix hazakensis]PZW36025.1 hypothetical protein EI42_00195 [Thermosporothrix hazakensis]GCE46677.1 hypothetical protein KTH_15460 [Thermosporothrix hazakensis]